jgi:hypothetical protein
MEEFMKAANLKPIIYHLAAISSVFGPATGFADSNRDKIKETVDSITSTIKGGIDKLGDDLNAIQQYLENYHWKGIIQEKASSGAMTLEGIKLNGHSKVVAVKPQEKIDGSVHCNLDREKCAALSFYRVVLGIKGEGPQETIGNELGLVAGESKEKFVLTAPKEPGLYQIRFRLVDAYFKGNALDAWEDEEGNEPDGTTTIGLIFVKSQ